MNRVEIEGVAYQAKPQMRGQTGTCAGCAAADPSLTNGQRTALCLAMPACMAATRDDGKFVIWVKEAASCSN